MACDHYLKANKIYGTEGHRSGRAHVLNELGWTQTLMGEYENALSSCTQAIALHQATGDTRGEAAAWDSLGYAHHCLGNYEEALACYQPSLALKRETLDHAREAITLSHIGDTYEAAGQSNAARAAWLQALDILITLSHPERKNVEQKLQALGPAVRATEPQRRSAKSND